MVPTSILGVTCVLLLGAVVIVVLVMSVVVFSVFSLFSFRWIGLGGGGVRLTKLIK